jgi:hypothetical protein
MRLILLTIVLLVALCSAEVRTAEGLEPSKKAATSVQVKTEEGKTMNPIVQTESAVCWQNPSFCLSLSRAWASQSRE